MVNISLREPDLSKCLVSRIVKVAIKLKSAPHNSIEKYIDWLLLIYFTPSAYRALLPIVDCCENGAVILTYFKEFWQKYA